MPIILEATKLVIDGLEVVAREITANGEYVYAVRKETEVIGQGDVAQTVTSCFPYRPVFTFAHGRHEWESALFGCCASRKEAKERIGERLHRHRLASQHDLLDPIVQAGWDIAEKAHLEKLRLEAIEQDKKDAVYAEHVALTAKWGQLEIDAGKLKWKKVDVLINQGDQPAVPTTGKACSLLPELAIVNMNDRRKHCNNEPLKEGMISITHIATGMRVCSLEEYQDRQGTWRAKSIIVALAQLKLDWKDALKFTTEERNRVKEVLREGNR